MAKSIAERWRLDGKTAVVTGGSKGIGLATAEELARLGAEVLMVARDGDVLEAAATRLADDGCKVSALSADVASSDDRQRLIDAVDARWGRLDVLVNNVGTNVRKPAVAYELDEYRRIMDVNLTATFELTRTTLPALRASGAAAVVNMASVAGLLHLRTGTPYAMSKAGMIQLTRNLACEWAAYGVRVNAVAPWYIDTPLARTVLSDETYRREVLGRTPLNRIGEPEEVAAAAAFLALPAASYITGQCLAVDGGFVTYGF